MASAQSCPANIGFEDGKFTNWVCYTGNINNDGTINLNAGGGPADTRQSILKNTSPQITDPYGGFPVNCPNGSKYSICRYGRKVFETRELLNHWKATYNGKAEPAGTYYWVFNSYDTYFKKTVVRSGSVTIIR